MMKSRNPLSRNSKISSNINKVNAIIVLAPCISFLSSAIWLIARGSFIHSGFRGFTLFDDAMISMRYAYNLANSGIIEWSHSTGNVEGFTNLGWMLLMSIILKLTDLYTAPLAVSILSALILLVGIALLGHRQSKYRIIPVSLRLVCLAGSFSLIFWGIRGFETSLIFLFISSLFILTTNASISLASRSIAIFVIVLFGTITRDDFAAFIFIYSTSLLIFKLAMPRWVNTTGSIPFILLLSAIASVALKAGFRLYYFGDLLPNTYYLKVYGHDEAIVIVRGLMAVYGTSLSVFTPVLLVLLLFLLLSPKICKEAFSCIKELNSHLVAFSLIVYSILVGGDAWEWSGIANRFTCAALPFLLLNFVQYVDILTRSKQFSFFYSRASLYKILPAYALLLPLTLLSGELYRQMILRLSSVIGGLWIPGDQNGMQLWQSWLIGGVCLLMIPLILRQVLGSKIPIFDRAPALIMSGMAIMIICLPWILIGNSELLANGDLLHVVADSRQAKASLESKKFISPGSLVISGWAGTYAYYRPDLDFADPFGKMDLYIAKSKPRWTFWPGHTKWNWDYTLTRYKPDFVTGSLNNLRSNTWLMDDTPEWNKYYQYQPGLVRRKY
jgi:hypothetical protein